MGWTVEVRKCACAACGWRGTRKLQRDCPACKAEGAVAIADARWKRWKASYRADGKEITKTFDHKGEAERWIRNNEKAIDDGDYIDPAKGRITLREYYTEHFLPNREHRPSTLARYSTHWRLYIGTGVGDQLALGDRPLRSITADHVKAWKVELSKITGRSTVATVLRQLKTILNAAVADERIARSPARNVENPSTDPKGGQRVLEAAELATLAEASEPRYRALVYLLGYRGLRIGEATALLVGDVDTMRGRVTISKTLTDISGTMTVGKPKTAAGERVVTLPTFLRELLAEHIATYCDPTDASGYVFTMPGGGPGRKEGEGGPLRVHNWRRRSFARAVEAMVSTVPDQNRQELLADLTPHDLRDTAATLAFQASATVKEVANMLGHANPSVTLRVYSGVLDSMSEKTDDALDEAFRNAKPTTPTPPAEVVAIAR